MLTSSFPRYEGDFFGPWILEYCRELKRQGETVYLLAPRPLDTDKTVLTETNLYIYRFDYFKPTRLQKLVYPPGIIPSLLENKYLIAALPTLFLQYFRKAYSIIEYYNIDIIHSQWAIPSGIIGAVLSKIHQIPHFITTQGAELYISKYNPLSILTKLAIRNSEMILPVSNMMKQKAMQLGIPEDKIEVVPNAVNTDFFRKKETNFRSKYKIHDDDYIILTIRRLVHEKRVDDVIHAFGKMDNKDKCHLVIGGDGPEKENLEKLVIELGLDDKVKFLGFVENNKLDKIYSASDMYVLSSQQEGLSLSMLESMASEVITISTGGTGGNDVIEDGENGFLFEVGNVLELKQILDEIISKNEEERQEISKKGRKTVVDNFSTKVMVKQLRARFKSSLKNFNKLNY